MEEGIIKLYKPVYAYAEGLVVPDGTGWKTKELLADRKQDDKFVGFIVKEFKFESK